MEFKIPFSVRAHAYTEEEVNTVIVAMNDANPLTQGKYLKAFEEKCMFGIAPANARIEAKNCADFITHSKAGEGAVLDACIEIKKRFID